MNDLEDWLAANDRYLATRLDWLRRRLERLARAGDKEESVALLTDQALQPPDAKKHSLWGRLFGSAAIASKPMPALPRMSDIDEDLGAPSGETTASPHAQAGPAKRLPALVELAQRLGLSEFEQNTLLLCIAMELDTGTGTLCARAQQDPARTYPTFALALSLFDQPAWDVLSPERPLRFWRLIEINQPGAQALITSALKADERIVNYIKGLNYLDDRLTPLLMPGIADAAPLPPSQTRVVDAIVDHLGQMKVGAPYPAFQLLGSDSQSKLMIAQRALAQVGMTLHRINADAIPTQLADHETFVRLWNRECVLLPIALYVDAAQMDRANGPQVSAVQRLLSRGMGLMFLGAGAPLSELDRPSIPLDVAKPTAAEQYAAWTAVLGEEGGEHSARLAGQFNFNVAAIRDIAASVRGVSGEAAPALWKACVTHARPTLDRLAQPLEPKATWRDLELAAPEKSLLRQIADQVSARMEVYDNWGFRAHMNRGFGISALFAGESGTGKTMAAEVIANELQLALYRIDLSAVVNKYIGETEKNLARLFDAAEDGGAILFFDEADALFGKRSEVKDSHDRYANIEINYLLQRMEAYRGLAILATNMKSSLDSAFLRRLRFVVNFGFPGPAERKAIWEKVFPSDTPLGTIDHARLARFNLTGGAIHNIAINSAFMAAQAGSPVTMPLVLEAARNEFRKMEKPINEADFRWLEPVEAKA